MGRQKNDGRGRIGGRQKGTPNKVTYDLREWITALIDGNRKQIEKDIATLEAKERLMILERLMGYVIPRQQSISAKVDFNTLSDEQLDLIIKELTEGT